MAPIEQSRPILTCGADDRMGADEGAGADLRLRADDGAGIDRDAMLQPGRRMDEGAGRDSGRRRRTIPAAWRMGNRSASTCAKTR